MQNGHLGSKSLLHTFFILKTLQSILIIFSFIDGELVKLIQMHFINVQWETMHTERNMEIRNLTNSGNGRLAKILKVHFIRSHWFWKLDLLFNLIWPLDKNFKKVRTLHSIVHELGHHGRIIDAVKIDIEGPRIGYEDKAIRSIIETVSF